jgi:MiaB/RimO family radical SAM methylthiotransferase
LTKNACVVCNGCPESAIDSARVETFLKINGWNTVRDIKEADLILFRACGLTQGTTEQSIQIVKTIYNEKKRTARVIVWGCLPKIDPGALRTVYRGVTFGEKEISTLNEILQAKTPVQEVTANRVNQIFTSNRPGLRGGLARAFDKLQIPTMDTLSLAHSISPSKSIFQIKVSTGCLGNCSYCSTRISRGTLKSKSIETILVEFRHGLNKGFRYFGLLGTEVGAYGRDLGYTLVDLLAEMTKERGNYKIGLRNVNPLYLNEMFEELRPFFSRRKIWFLLSPAESGSDRILELMGRKYKIEEFKRCIKTINEEFSDILLRTQLMVGFPTETEKDFEKSVDLLDCLRFDWVEVYKFSPRPGTIAAKMADQIPEKTKEDRYRRLHLKALMQRPRKKVKYLLRHVARAEP